jgi:hypothetical protein
VLPELLQQQAIEGDAPAPVQHLTLSKGRLC